MAAVLSEGQVDVYTSLLGSWEKNWELVYEASGGAFIRQEGYGLDTFFKNGLWASWGGHLKEYLYDPASGKDIELLKEDYFEPTIGAWDIDLDLVNTNGGLYFNLLTAPGYIFEDQDAISWNAELRIFLDEDNANKLTSSTSLDAFEETNIVAIWNRRDADKAYITELEEQLSIDLDEDGVAGGGEVLGLQRPFTDSIVYESTGLRLDLTDYFELVERPDIGTLVAFDTNRESEDDLFYVELYNKAGSTTLTGDLAIETPITADNFLNYVRGDAYNNTFIHRSVSGFVMQGGGFQTPTVSADEPGSDPIPVASGPKIINEPGNSNIRGEVAMAKLSNDPNSATNQFFFNLGNNSSDLDIQNGGFTVFGKVLGSGMEVIDAMAAATTYGADVYYANAAFSDLPLWQLSDDGIIKPEDFVSFEDVYIVPQDQVAESLRHAYSKYGESSLMEFYALSSDDTRLQVSLDGSDLVITPTERSAGTVTVTVSARSVLGGSIVSDSFDVTLQNDQAMNKTEESIFNSFLDQIWMLYDGYLDRTALLKLTDNDGSVLGGPEQAQYELIYVQPESINNSTYQAYYSSGIVKPSSYGGYASLQLGQAHESIDLVHSPIEVSFGSDGVYADIQLPRLVVPTTESFYPQLMARYTSPLNSNQRDWALEPWPTDLDVESLFSLSPYITVDIINLFRGETASEYDLFNSVAETWNIAQAVAIALGKDESHDDATVLESGYLESLFHGVESIPFYLSGSEEFESMVLELIRALDAVIDLDFERTEDNSRSLIDVYLHNASPENGWVAEAYPQYLQLDLDFSENISEVEAKSLVNEMLSHTFGVNKVSSLSESDIYQLMNLWGAEDDESVQQLLENQGIEGAIARPGEVDFYDLSINISDLNVESYLLLATESQYADLDISLIDEYGDEIAYSATTNRFEYIDLSSVSPGDYSVEIYGYGDAIGEYLLSYITAVSGSNDPLPDSTVPWSADEVINIGFLNGKTSITTNLETGSAFYSFNIEGDTYRGRWKVDIEDSPWDSDLDMYLYRAEDPFADIVLSSADPGSNETLSLRGLEQGSYILEIRNYINQQADYSLVFRTPRNDNDNQPDIYESNNNIENATPIDAGAGPFGGLNIHSANDKDFFRFVVASTGQEDSYVAISMEHNSGDLDLNLYNSEGDLQYSSASSAPSEIISLAGLPAGSYTAEVSGFGGATGFYELFFNVPDGASLTPDSHEVFGGNNILESASVLGKISGYLVIDDDLTISENGDDVDFYTFKLAGDGNSNHYIALAGDAGTADLDIKLYNTESDEELLIAYSTNWGSIETISLNGLKANVAYALEVLSYNNEESSYSLVVNAPTDSLRDDPYERNNEEERATNLNLENGRLYWDDLNLSSDTDVDWYEINIPDNVSSGSYLRVSSLGNLDTIAVQLKDRDSGEVIYSDESLYSSTEIHLAGLIHGNYLMKVSGKQSQYTLEVELTESSANVLILPDVYDGEGSGNNSSQSATTLRSGFGKLSVESLTIHDENDLDWFQFSLPSGGNQSHGLGIEFNSLEGDLDLEIYSIINGALGDAVGSSSGTADHEFISFDGLSSGTYAAKIFAYSGISSDYTLALDVPSNSISPDSFETNNSLEQAYDLRTLSGISRLSGSIHSVNDQDFFRFRTLADTTVAHAVTISAASDLELSLYNSNGDKISSGIGSINLSGLKANSDYAISISNLPIASGTSNYELSFQLPTQSSTSSGGGEGPAVTPSLSDWTLMVYLTASDLDQFAFNDINELEDAVNRFAGEANVAVYWDQSAAGSVNPFSTGNNRQTAWSTAGKAFIKPDTDFSKIVTDFLVEDSEINTGSPDTLFNFINWAASEAPAEKYGLIMWDHGAGIYGSNLDNADNVQDDLLINSELLQALDLSKAAGVDFDLIAFDACLMAMTEIAYELKDFTDYYVASEEIELGAGYDYTTAFSVFDASIGSVSAKDLARSLVTSFENYYIAPDNIADTLSAINTNKLDQLALNLKAFTEAGSVASVAEREVMSSLRDQAIAYESVFGASYEKNYIDLGNWLSKVSANSSLSQSLKDRAQAALVSLQASVEHKTRDSRNSLGLAIYFPATSRSQDPVKDYKIGYETQFKNFLDDTGWYSFLGTLNGLSSRETADSTSARTLNLGLDNVSAGKALNLGLLSGANNSIPLSSNATNGKSFFAFRFEGSTDDTSSLKVSGLTSAEVSVRSSGNPKVLLSGTNSVLLTSLEPGEYIVEIDSLDSVVIDRPSLQLNLPEAQSQVSIPNDKAAKASDIGLFGSDRLVPGGLISSGQTAYFRFETPRFPSARFYGLQLLAGGSSIINARILTSDGKTTISEASGSGQLDMSYRATGNGESYLLEVSSPSSQQSRTALATPRVTSFSLAVEADINQIPSDILLSSVKFDENISSGSTIAVLRSTDPDLGDTFTYALVSGIGDTDNAAFSIDGAKIKINSSPDYETQSAYSIRVQTTDAGGLTVQKPFTLLVNNLDDTPTPELKPSEPKPKPSEVSDPITTYSTGGNTIIARLNQIDEIIFTPSSLKGLTPDIITGFEPGSDKLILSKSIFKKLQSTKLTTLIKQKDLKKASQGLSKSQLVYNKITGQLIYDENGKKKGFGKGGVFAQFNDETLPTLTAADFEFG